MTRLRRIWFYLRNRREIDAYIDHALAHDMYMVAHQHDSMDKFLDLWVLMRRFEHPRGKTS
jgi:hypothetical protein